MLYRLLWGAKNTHGKKWEKLKKEFDARLKQMTKDAMKNGWLKPQVVRGYFPCQSDGDRLLIYGPASVSSAYPLQNPLTTFHARTRCPGRGSDGQLSARTYSPRTCLAEEQGKRYSWVILPSQNSKITKKSLSYCPSKKNLV